MFLAGHYKLDGEIISYDPLSNIKYPPIEFSGRDFATHRTEFLNDIIKINTIPLYRISHASASTLSRHNTGRFYVNTFHQQ